MLENNEGKRVIKRISDMSYINYWRVKSSHKK